MLFFSGKDLECLATAFKAAVKGIFESAPLVWPGRVVGDCLWVVRRVPKINHFPVDWRIFSVLRRYANVVIWISSVGRGSSFLILGVHHHMQVQGHLLASCRCPFALGNWSLDACLLSSTGQVPSGEMASGLMGCFFEKPKREWLVQPHCLLVSVHIFLTKISKYSYYLSCDEFWLFFNFQEIRDAVL